MFASHSIIVVLEKYSKEFIGQTWQIWKTTYKAKQEKKKKKWDFYFPQQNIRPQIWGQ